MSFPLVDHHETSRTCLPYGDSFLQTVVQAASPGSQQVAYKFYEGFDLH